VKSWNAATSASLTKPIEEVQIAAEAACGELRSLIATLGATTGVECLDSRLKPCGTIVEFQHAFMLLRAALVRSLIDDRDVTITEASLLMGISRQMVSRLYQAGGATESCSA